MKKLLTSMFVVLLATAIALPLVAQDKQKKKRKKKGQRGNAAVVQMMNRLKKLNLSDEQKEKIKKIAADHGPKLAAVTKKVRETLTRDELRARQEAGKKARSEGKKGRELQAAINAVVPKEKQKAYAAAQKEARAAQAAFRNAVAAVLTDEQKKEAKLVARKKGKKKATRKKKKKKDDG